VFPLADENIGRRIRPVVNYALIAANVLVHLALTVALAPAAAFPFFVEWGVQPREIVRLVEWETLLSSMFLHGSWAHLLGNMLYLHVFGDNIEDAMGHGRYLAFFLLTGLAASLAQIAIDPASGVPLIGASGAVSGVLGAYVVLFPHGKVRTLILFVFVRLLPAWVLLGLWFVMQLASAATGFGRPGAGGVAFMAHVGGFVAGALLARIFANPTEVARQNAVREQHRRLEAMRQGAI
jgi:membrane associated rhomboid family serine protease